MQSRIKTHQFLFALSILFLAMSCQKTEVETTEWIPKQQIDDEITKTLKSGDVFRWQRQKSDFIYSAGMQSDSIFSIGYKIDGFESKRDIQDFNFEDSQWNEVRSSIEKIILKYENEKSMKSLMPQGEVTNFPQIIVQLSNAELVRELKNHPNVRFVEPLGYTYNQPKQIIVRSGAGCSGNPDYGIPADDYDVIQPNAKASWGFAEQNVQEAWSTSSGDNVKLCIIDTGASFDQDNLGGAFNQGYSSGRSLQRLSTLYSGMWWWRELTSPHDECGHGTEMAGIAAAPRGVDGNSAGIAYNADLMTIKAVENVIINTSNEKSGVRDALYLAGGSDVDIISMSIGTPFYSSTVADGIFYAYNQNKLMFAAAGTSLSWTSWYPVIFPANMSETNACTGVKDMNHYQKCTTCHSGSQVMFTAPVERSVDSDRSIISLALYSDQPNKTGASSGSTATTAGIAALVLSTNPNMSRADIIQRLKESGEFYGNVSSSLGYGVVSAELAVENN